MKTIALIIILAGPLPQETIDTLGRFTTVDGCQAAALALSEQMVADDFDGTAVCLVGDDA